MSAWSVSEGNPKRRAQRAPAPAAKPPKRARGSAPPDKADAKGDDEPRDDTVAKEDAQIRMRSERDTIREELRQARAALAALPEGRSTILTRKDLEETIDVLEQRLTEHDTGYKGAVVQDVLESLTAVHINDSDETRAAAPRESVPLAIDSVSSRLRRKPHSVEGNKDVRTAQNVTASMVVADDINVVFGNSDNPATYVHDTHTCECGAEIPSMRTDGNTVCGKCGATLATLDTTTSGLAYGDKVECTTFSYKRHNHFLEWLLAFQGKQKTVIPPDVIQSVCQEIKEMEVTEITDITPKDIRAILKKLKHRKYYEHSILIHHLVTGIEPPRLLPNEEDQLRCLFLAMQAPFSVPPVGPEEFPVLLVRHVQAAGPLWHGPVPVLLLAAQGQGQARAARPDLPADLHRQRLGIHT